MNVFDYRNILPNMNFLIITEYIYVKLKLGDDMLLWNIGYEHSTFLIKDKLKKNKFSIKLFYK